MTTAEMREELAEIAASVRALVEWYGMTGASGLVTEASPDEILASIAAPQPGRAGARRGAPPGMHAPDFGRAEQPAGRPAQERAAAAPPQGSQGSQGSQGPQGSQGSQGAPASFTPPAAHAAPAHAPPAHAAPTHAPHAHTPPQPSRDRAQPPPGPLTSAATPAVDLSRIGRPARPEPAALPLGAEAPAAIRTAVTGSESQEERRVKLATLADEVSTCTRCGLSITRTQTVFARGNPLAELCFVGEGPGADEDAQGFPFVGKAGQLLDKMILAMGYGRDDVYICNIVKCRPPENRKPEPDEMAACNPFITAQLELLKPRVIVALGATAVQGLTGAGEGITRMRGKWKLYKGTTPLMPTFHPAYLLRQPEAKREVWSDLQQVMKFLGKKPPGKGAS